MTLLVCVTDSLTLHFDSAAKGQYVNLADYNESVTFALPGSNRLDKHPGLMTAQQKGETLQKLPSNNA